VTDTPDPWGPYRATIEDHLDTCVDYLSRLRRSLAGEIAPDRHYFADKADQLHIAARRMVRIVQDIDGWLGECAATVEHTDATGIRVSYECGLPGGHEGPHQDGTARMLIGSRTVDDLRDLADAVETMSQRFGWAAPGIDRERTGAPGTISNGHDALANLAVTLDTLGGRARRLAGRVGELALDQAEPRVVDASGKVESSARSRTDWPGPEL
jgi:hypothetical protein